MTLKRNRNRGINADNGHNKMQLNQVERGHVRVRPILSTELFTFDGRTLKYFIS